MPLSTEHEIGYTREYSSQNSKEGEGSRNDPRSLLQDKLDDQPRRHDNRNTKVFTAQGLGKGHGEAKASPQRYLGQESLRLPDGLAHAMHGEEEKAITSNEEQQEDKTDEPKTEGQEQQVLEGVGNGSPGFSRPQRPRYKYARGEKAHLRFFKKCKNPQCGVCTAVNRIWDGDRRR